MDEYSTYELVQELLARYRYSNGFEFITEAQKQALLEALNDPDTATS